MSSSPAVISPISSPELPSQWGTRPDSPSELPNEWAIPNEWATGESPDLIPPANSPALDGNDETIPPTQPASWGPDSSQDSENGSPPIVNSQAASYARAGSSNSILVAPRPMPLPRLSPVQELQNDSKQ